MTISSTTECDCCDFAAASFQCSRHPLMGGKNLTAQLVKEMHQASLMGHLWGDSMYELEQAELAAETPAQLSARLEKQEAAEEAGAQQLKQYELQKRAAINTDAKTGALKHSSGMACRDAEEPAKWVVGKRKLGNYQEWAATDPLAKSQPTKRPAGVPSNAVFWPYGCEHHEKKRSCEHLHPGQPGYEAAKAAKAAKTGKKHAGAEAIIANACFLSSKPAPKPSPLSKPVPVMQDSW
jgi:hypothetical protein